MSLLCASCDNGLQITEYININCVQMKDHITMNMICIYKKFIYKTKTAKTDISF